METHRNVARCEDGPGWEVEGLPGVYTEESAKRLQYLRTDGSNVNALDVMQASATGAEDAPVSGRDDGGGLETHDDVYAELDSLADRFKEVEDRVISLEETARSLGSLVSSLRSEVDSWKNTASIVVSMQSDVERLKAAGAVFGAP